MTPPSARARETELKLRIAGADAGAVIRRIAALTHVGAYRLSPQPDQSLHDIHLDTPDAALGSARVALRIRQMGGLTWLAVKGPSRNLPGDLVDRTELEAPWSPAAYARARAELQALGIAIRDPIPDSTQGCALEALRTAGLEVVQDRDARRIVRDVVRGKNEAAPVAELVADAVTYHLSGVDVRHYEVELESRSDDGPAVVVELADDLLQLFGPALRPWTVDKIALGAALERLRLDGALAGALGRGGVLTETAYARIIRDLGA